MAGNPVLGFLQAPPTTDGPHGTVSTNLRFLGMLVLVGLALSVLGAIFVLTLGNLYSAGTELDGIFQAATTAAAIMGIAFSIVIYGLILFWITYAYNAWNHRDPRGATHVLIIAILSVVFGGIGVLGALMGGVLTLFGAATPLYLVINLLQALVAIGYVFCGAMILANRGKALAGTGAPGAAV